VPSALVRPLSLEQGQRSGKDSARDAHRIAVFEIWRRRQLYQPVALASLQLSNHPVRHLRRAITVEYQAKDSGTPPRSTLLELDQHEGIAGKQRRRLHPGLARRSDALNAQSW
jgi:hypothetical protein